jgi:hypothetical protein
MRSRGWYLPQVIWRGKGGRRAPTWGSWDSPAVLEQAQGLPPAREGEDLALRGP